MERTTVRTRDPNLGKVVLYQLSHVRAQESIIRKPVFRATPFFDFFTHPLLTNAHDKTSKSKEKEHA